MKKIILIALALYAAPGHARSIEEATSVLNGTEVIASGKIFIDETTTLFSDERNTLYHADFAVDRDTARRLDECRSREFRKGCDVDIQAELKVRGSNIELLIYNVKFN